MNTVCAFGLKAFRTLYLKFSKTEQPSGYLRYDELPVNTDMAAELIYDQLNGKDPCMIARFGAFEFATIRNFIGVKVQKHSFISYITGKSEQWWWEDKLLNLMQSNAGFFPANHENAIKFGRLMLEDTKLLDILGVWMEDYIALNAFYPANLKFVHVSSLEPFWAKINWTMALESKRVLVIHPFAELIESQYRNKREQLGLLPLFELKTIKAVQSIGGYNVQFQNWFEALHYMEEEIDKADFDVALLGCGAYGFPLAAYIKRKGKKAVHLGGALQLLFGIRGKRWEDPNFGVVGWGLKKGSYLALMNEYWVRPDRKNTPKNADKVEGACYW